MTSTADHERSVRAVLGAVPVRDRTVGVTAVDIARHPARTRARRLTRDVSAAADVPLFDNSQMDGYAVRAADLADADATHPVTLPVSEPIAAGRAAGALDAGTAAPIMTGAPVPAGADSIVAIERTEPGDFNAAHVTFVQPVAPGAFVRPRAADIARGAPLAPAGTPLRPAHLGAFAAAGVREVTVAARVRVLVVTTGLELAPDEPAEPGVPHAASGVAPHARIEDAVSGMLLCAITAAGARARRVLCPSDDPEHLRRLLAEHGSWPDLVVTVGGVSRGAYEVVKLAFASEDVTFSHLALQPGGPQGQGTIAVADRVLPVLCFPGNPVSALISFELFLRPWLRERAGLTPERRRELRPLSEPIDSPAHQHQIRRGRLNDDGSVAPVGGPGSHLIAHYASADALVHIPVGVTRVERGDEVEVWILDD